MFATITNTWKNAGKVSAHLSHVRKSVKSINDLTDEFFATKDREHSKHLKKCMQTEVRGLITFMFNDVAITGVARTNGFGIGGDYYGFQTNNKARNDVIKNIFEDAFKFHSKTDVGCKIVKLIRNANDNKAPRKVLVAYHKVSSASDAIKAFFRKIWNWIINLFKKENKDAADPASTATEGTRDPSSVVQSA